MKYALVIIDEHGNVTASTFLSPDTEERVKELEVCVDALLSEAEKLQNQVE